MYAMLSFICFKSKEFTSLICVYSQQSKSQRYISHLQVKNNQDRHTIHDRYHRTIAMKTAEFYLLLYGVMEVDFGTKTLTKSNESSKKPTLPRK